MDIQSTRAADHFLITLTGRLDAAWADPVQAALDAVVRDGEHHIVLDVAGVDYISSAGLRVLIGGYKQLRTIQGSFLLRNAQPGVAKVIELSGLASLLGAVQNDIPAPTVRAQSFVSANAEWESYGTASPVKLTPVGDGSSFDTSQGSQLKLSSGLFALGIAALAVSREEALPRLGEFLSIAGCSAHLPPGNGGRPDFALTEQAFVPTAWMSSGLIAVGEPELLLRFRTATGSRGVTLAELAATVIEQAHSEAAMFVLAAEVAGLVGASLRQSPAEFRGDALAFPEIKDQMNFTSERAFRETSCAAVGVVATAGSAWAEHLRPMGNANVPLGHVHAAVFPYRPIRQGEIVLEETVRGLFDAGGLQGVLHLLNDTREPDGSGDSEFLRGACWVAPLSAS